MATQWVRPTNGNDANDGLTFATAKQTINAACYAGTRGAIVYLVAEAPISLTAQYDLSPDNGTNLGGRLFVGVNASGVEDGTKFVFQPGVMDSAQETAAATAFLVNQPFYRRTNNDNDKNCWRNIHFDAGGKFGFCASAAIGNGLMFVHCKFTGAKSATLSTNNAVTLYACEISGCEGSLAIQGSLLIACWVHDNAGTGCRPRTGLAAIGSVFSNNTNMGVDLLGGGIPSVMFACVSHNNGSHGFRLSGFFNNCMDSMFCCVATSNGGNGFRNNDAGNRSSVQNCIAGSGAMANTSGASANTTDFGLVSGEPVYRDPANGDFTITNLADFGAAFAPFGAFGETVTRVGGDWLRGHVVPGGGGTRAYWG